MPRTGEFFPWNSSNPEAVPTNVTALFEADWSKPMSTIRNVAVIGLALGLSLSAKAGFVNGGFETGDFTGWTLEYASYTDPFTTLASPNGHQYVIGSTTDPYAPFVIPFSGSYTARLNEPYSGGGDVSRISQTGTMAAGETEVYINWGAVMEDPEHPVEDQPFFDIEVYKNGALIASESHNASQGPTDGWQVSPNDGSVYYNSGTFHVSGLAEGDTVRIVMTAADCMQGGHVGYAYLDGIGTAPTPIGVPDGGSTALLLIPAIAGLALLRRRN